MKAGSALLFRQITLITLLVGTVSVFLILINTERLSRSLLAGTRAQAEAVAVQTATAVEAALADAPGQTPQQAIRDSQPLREFAQSTVRRAGLIESLTV